MIFTSLSHTQGEIKHDVHIRGRNLGVQLRSLTAIKPKAKKEEQLASHYIVNKESKLGNLYLNSMLVTIMLYYTIK